MLGKTTRETVPGNVSEDLPTSFKKARTRKTKLPTAIAATGEKRSSGGKPRLSCAECRRLKLKCDRVFPCQTCCKRGVADICPQGSLASGQGSRFILANTEQLHAKISQMRARIQTLEDALQTMQTRFSSEPHPLLDKDLLLVKTFTEFYRLPKPPLMMHTYSPEDQLDIPESDSEKFGNSPTEDQIEECSNNYRERSKTLRVSPPPSHRKERASGFPHLLKVSSHLMQLSQSFPTAWSINNQIRDRIRGLLPPLPEAELLCKQAHLHALSQCNPDPNETFLPNLLRHVYNSPPEILCSRRLGVFLMVLAIGTVVDLSGPCTLATADAYYHLARASTCEIAMTEEPTFDLLNALFLMVLYLVIISADRRTLCYAGTILDTVANLAEGLEFYRDGTGLGRKVIPEELERQRALLWGLVNLDTRLSLTLCRPPSLSSLRVDCKLPAYAVDNSNADAVLYHEWRFSFLSRCLTPILDLSTLEVPPDYDSILELDKAVRDFPLLDALREPARSSPKTTTSVLQRVVVATSRQIALLQLHRNHFARSLGLSDKSTPAEYVPSILATFSSACRLISTLDTFYSQEPLLCSRFVRFWSNAASAAMTLRLIASRVVCSHLIFHALQAMKRVCRLFNRASDNPFTRNVMPHLVELTGQTEQIHREQLNTHDMQPLSPKMSSASHHFAHQLHPALLMDLQQTFSDYNPKPAPLEDNDDCSVSTDPDVRAHVRLTTLACSMESPKTDSSLGALTFDLMADFNPELTAWL